MIRIMALINNEFEGLKRDVVWVAVVRWDLDLIQTSWATYNRSIMIDGYNDMKKQNIINILLFSCEGTNFLTSIDTSTNFLWTPITTTCIHGHIKQSM